MVTDSASLLNFVPNSHGNKEMSVKETVSLSTFLTAACTKSFVVCSLLYALEGEEAESKGAHRGQGLLQMRQGHQAEMVMTRATEK